MKPYILFAIWTLFNLNPGLAQVADVFVAIPGDRIVATASSEHNDFPVGNAVDGSGMIGNFHQSDNLGKKMWISGVSKKPVRANSQVREGIVWLMCEFKSLEKEIDLIQIWNHNQNLHTQRGLRKIYIEYSADGKNWELLKNGKSDFFIVPQSVGRKQEPVSLSAETGGIDARYICITADIGNGNYYYVQDPAALIRAKDLNQNPDYYGLSEIRFYRQQSVPLTDLPRIDSVEFRAGQGYLKTDKGPAREFAAKLSVPLFTGGTMRVTTSSGSRTIIIEPSGTGITQLEGTFPEGYMEEKEAITLELESPQGSIRRKVDIPGARQWKLYFLPHSHLDIGYTHRQQDVMDLQIRNLEHAIDLADRTRNYSEGARFKWNAEATWAVDGFLAKYQGTETEQRFIDAVKRGDIGLDATLGSILTGISKQEELMHLFDDAHKIARLTGVEINTAMMSDVPGQSWGTVTAMAENGVRYFSSGPNYVPTLGRLGSHGVGLYNLKWGDVPFWWESQAGTHKILYWQTGKGYSMFHGWLMDRLSVCGVEPVWDYLQELEVREYPYSLTYLRYTIHGDNGPPDEDMPDVIRMWNEKYESPSFIIGTTKELFTEMERTYGEYLPVYSGDMTPIWEDGAASTARELAMNRESAERLNQFEILWSMTRPGEDFPSENLLEGWKNVVLFSEHTWGAAASGPEPESTFTRDVWAGKKYYADQASRISGDLMDNLLKSLGGDGPEKYINVYNTNLWRRSDVVRITDIDLSGKNLSDRDGTVVPVQKMADGSWIFIAKELEPMSAKPFRIVPATSKSEYTPMADGHTLDNGRIKLVIDELKGTVKSFTASGSGYEYAAKEGFNQFLYTGRNGENLQGIDSVVSITIVNDGSVATTLRVESAAPGCRSLISDITLYRDLDRADIVNTIDKLNIYSHENVRFRFPFNFDNPEVAMDLAMSVMHPERDQLVSANKSFYSVQNGISVSDIRHGIYLSTIDAPFVELGSMTADLSRQLPEATGWLNSATVSGDVYSWVMNNRWRTNYKASQEGLVSFRYALMAFDPQFPDLKRFGSGQAQPLVAVASDRADESVPIFALKGNNRIILSTIRPSADGKGYLVRLQNAAAHTAWAALESKRMSVSAAYLSDNLETDREKFNYSSFWLKPYECITIKLITN
jgi:hypothetical protein